MNWKNFFGIAIGIIALRVVGLIPSIWLAAGFVVVVWFWSYLLDQFPRKKRLINWSLSILLIASITGTIGWNLYVSYIQPYSEMSGAAWERAKFAADLKMSLRLNPDMLKSRRELAGQLQSLQDIMGDQQEKKLFDIRRRLQSRLITPQEAWGDTEKILKEESEYRERVKKAVSQILGQESLSPAKTSATAAPAILDYPLCANGDYDFSNLDIKKVGKVEFPVSDGCWVKVTLPSKDCVTHDPTVEVKKVWDNGAVDIDGPNRVVPARTGNIIFVKSLQGEGVYKILARK